MPNCCTFQFPSKWPKEKGPDITLLRNDLHWNRLGRSCKQSHRIALFFCILQPFPHSPCNGIPWTPTATKDPFQPTVQHRNEKEHSQELISPSCQPIPHQNGGEVCRKHPRYICQYLLIFHVTGFLAVLAYLSVQSLWLLFAQVKHNLYRLFKALRLPGLSRDQPNDL